MLRPKSNTSLLYSMQKNSTLKEYDHINMADIVHPNFFNGFQVSSKFKCSTHSDVISDTPTGFVVKLVDWGNFAC